MHSGLAATPVDEAAAPGAPTGAVVVAASGNNLLEEEEESAGVALAGDGVAAVEG
jgi:hypothetical protein